MNSEVARLRAQIEQEHTACVWALTGLSSGNVQHAFITRLMGHMDIAYRGLARIIGEEQATEVLCETLRLENKHLLCGTTARYIMQNADRQNEVQIVLIWRGVSMPPEEERQAALAAFFADLAEVLDWQTALFAEGMVLLHA